MLINFCRKSLGTTINCSTVSNDGYEVTNLILDNDKGFLAYSCIKPPIHIDLTFLCDIQLSHVKIWPSVGAQKSSGFELSAKSIGDASIEYTRVSTAYLKSSQSGVLFYRRDVDSRSADSPGDFLERYIQISNGRIVNRVRILRLSILRTENSVPAIGRIEVWGRVSRSCSEATTVKVHGLWQSNFVRPNIEVKHSGPSLVDVTKSGRDSADGEFNVPESFLDPITCNIMIQPVVLPSGATIDQSTLEKHGETEATWGRVLSDPFTGLPFNETRKPVVASALKARIDKFLLENKHTPEVKSLPRLSGHKQVRMSLRNRSLDLTGISFAMTDGSTLRSSPRSVAVPASVANSKITQESRVHRLPVIPMFSKRAIVKKKSKSMSIKYITNAAIRTEMNKTDKLNFSEGENNVDNTVLSNIQRFDVDNRATDVRDCLKDCNCASRIFYKLPCDHVICRDALTSIRNSQCAICDSHYDSGGPVRIHRH